MLTVNVSQVDMDITKRHASKYRVKLCLQPLLVSADNTQLPEHRGAARDYRKVLLESRLFFPEKKGQYKDWDEKNSKVIGKAVVLVEEVMQDEVMCEGIIAGPDGEEDSEL
jgi:predicted transcriptional regulator